MADAKKLPMSVAELGPGTYHGERAKIYPPSETGSILLQWDAATEKWVGAVPGNKTEWVGGNKTVRVLAQAVMIYVAERGAVRAKDNYGVQMLVDADGFVSFPYITYATGGGRTEEFERALDFLVEEQEIVCWQQIGEEQHELFLTEKARKMFAEQLGVLGAGWQDWNTETKGGI